MSGTINPTYLKVKSIATSNNFNIDPLQVILKQRQQLAKMILQCEHDEVGFMIDMLEKCNEEIKRFLIL